jgi:hypothetical protein
MEVTRQVGDITISDTTGTAGLVFAPLAVPLGVLAVVGGPALALKRGRRLAGVALALIGMIGIAAVSAGAVRAAGLDGMLTGGPAAAGGGALLVAVAGVLALRRAWTAHAAPGSRYTVEGVHDREWDLAAEEDSS